MKVRLLFTGLGYKGGTLGLWRPDANELWSLVFPWGMPVTYL